MSVKETPAAREIYGALEETRERTLELIADLSDDQLMGPRLRIVNPLLWEIGHVAYFQEYWVLRHARRQAPLLGSADALYDSARVAHDTRWDLPLPPRRDTLDYMRRVLDGVTGRAETPASAAPGQYGEEYFLQLALLHECMHDEAVTYTRQTLGYSAPRVSVDDPEMTRGAAAGAEKPGSSIATADPGDAAVPGGRFLLGNVSDASFVFDNERDAHYVNLRPFSISRAAVTNAQFAQFVGDEGYKRRKLWSDAGWRWREGAGAGHPVYWRPLGGGRWERRNFDRQVTLEQGHPVLHVNWYEAEAYCRWAGRRLPTEAEWETAASAEPSRDGRALSERKRRYPWGDEPPSPDRANLDWRAMGCVDADSLPAGDSAFGCRQMIGNVWEWTADDFSAYPGFVAGPYKEYSEPWFGDHKVLRGGCWVTRSRLISNTYRNFYTPDRRDVWAGFRTCAL